MRSKALPPARAQGHIVPFLEAAALFAALCIFARTAALMLAAAITAPLPMAETLFWLGRQSAQEQPASSVQVEAAPDSTPEAAASSLPQAVQALTGNIEDYLVPLLGEGARPADAGTVIEKNYPQGSGEKYVACGAGSLICIGAVRRFFPGAGPQRHAAAEADSADAGAAMSVRHDREDGEGRA